MNNEKKIVSSSFETLRSASSALRTNGFFECDRNTDICFSNYDGYRLKINNKNSHLELSVRPEEGVFHAASKDELKY